MEKGKEVEMFVRSLLSYIRDEASRYDTTTEFIEDCILDVVFHLKANRIKG